MTLRKQGNDVRFIFKGTSARAGLLLVFQIGVLCFAAAFGLVMAVTGYQQEKYAMTAFGAVIAAGMFYMCWRMLVRITKREQLVVSSEALTVITRVSGHKTEQKYPVTEIQNLCFVGDGFEATHPLQSDNLDALGFGMRQGMVNAVAAEGNIAFYHDGRQIRFGIGVSSWEAEQLDKHIRELTKERLEMAGLPEDIPEAVWNK